MIGIIGCNRYDTKDHPIVPFLLDPIHVRTQPMHLTVSTAHFESIPGVYTGDILNGTPHGKGRFESRLDTYYADRVSYTGEWQNGAFHGAGTLKEIFATEYKSHTYDGHWVTGSMQGAGTCTTLVNTEYTDTTRDDTVHYEVITGQLETNAFTEKTDTVVGTFPLVFYCDEDIIDLIEFGYVQHMQPQQCPQSSKPYVSVSV